MKHFSSSAGDTKKIAKEFAKKLTGGEVILLEGELGAGKTTFVQGLAEYCGVKQPVRSPTYVLMHVYTTCLYSIQEIVHLDFYRLLDTDAKVTLSDLGLEEYLDRDDVVIVAEWPPEHFFEHQKTIRVSLRIVSESEREIVIG